MSFQLKCVVFPAIAQKCLSLPNWFRVVAAIDLPECVGRVQPFVGQLAGGFGAKFDDKRRGFARPKLRPDLAVAEPTERPEPEQYYQRGNGSGGHDRRSESQ